MTATPPGGMPPHQQQQQQQQGFGTNQPMNMARLPIPGNAEFLLWLVVVVVFALVAAIADDVDSHMWMIATTWITAAYLLSRGLAKASRVLEH
jgi:hypothetical protein